MKHSEVSCPNTDTAAVSKTVELVSKLMDDPVKESKVVMDNQYSVFVKHIPDRFKSLDELFAAIRAVGLESSNVIIGK